MLASTENRRALVARVQSGDRRAIARMLTGLDDGVVGSEDAAALLSAAAGRALVVGITGVPGGANRRWSTP